MDIYGVSKSSTNNLQKLRAVLAYIVKTYSIFALIEFARETFKFATYPVQPDLAGNKSVAQINGELNKNVWAPSDSSGTQRKYGEEFVIDEAYLNDLELGDVTPQGLIKQLENNQFRLSKKVLLDFLYDFFHGSNLDGEILGLNTFVKDVAAADGQTEVYGLTKEQIHDRLFVYGKALDLNDEVSLRLFHEMLMEQLNEVEGNPVIITNSSMNARLTSIAQKLNQLGTIEARWGQRLNTFGKAPLVNVPNNILPFTEADGGDNKSSSIHIVNFDEVDGVRVATNAGVKFTDFEVMEEKPSGKFRIQVFGNLKIENPKSYKRISRVRL